MSVAGVRAVLTGVSILAGAGAMAAGITYDGCTDYRGRKVQSIQDLSLPAVVQSMEDVDGALLRYNPTALPRLGERARLFLYAQACASLNLGYRAGSALSLRQARRADCWGVTTLRRSGLLSGPGELAAVQAELDFSDAEWAQVPGPRRGFDFEACRSEALRIPRAANVTSEQWGACIHRCGDRLFHCGRSDACMTAFQQCSSQCDSGRSIQ